VHQLNYWHDLHAFNSLCVQQGSGSSHLFARIAAVLFQVEISWVRKMT